MRELKMQETKKKLLDFTSDDLRSYVYERGLFTDDDVYHGRMDSYFDYLSLGSEDKNDTLVSLYAVRNNSFNLYHVPEEVKNDASFLSSCLKHNINSFERMTPNELQKKGVVAYVSVAMPKLFNYYPEELKNDPKFWASVVSINKDVVNHLPPEIVSQINKYKKSLKPVQAQSQEQEEGLAPSLDIRKRKGDN